MFFTGLIGAIKDGWREGWDEDEKVTKKKDAK
jgi:hypothetical protein